MNGFCNCGGEHPEELKTSSEKIDRLKEAIAELGFEVTENENGEINIAQTE